MDTSFYTATVAFIKDVGFPVFVAVYLLVRGDVLLRDIRDELRAMNGKPPKA